MIEIYNQFLIHLDILTKKYTQMYWELHCLICVKEEAKTRNNLICVKEEAKTRNYNKNKWILCIITVQF